MSLVKAAWEFFSCFRNWLQKSSQEVRVGDCLEQPMTHVNHSKATWWHKLPMLGLLLFMVLLLPVLILLSLLWPMMGLAYLVAYVADVHGVDFVVVVVDDGIVLIRVVLILLSLLLLMMVLSWSGCWGRWSERRKFMTFLCRWKESEIINHDIFQVLH